VPLTVVRLSEALVFATLPGEFTTTQGRLVEDRLQRTLGAADVWPIGLANEYVSYFTTPAEYAAQHYEGGSTLYGPAAGDAVVEQLAQVPAGQSEELERRYRVGKRLKKMPKYPPLERETCCPYTERCNARQLLGIPETYPISCVDEGSPKRADQEDIHFEGPPGTRWTLRVDLGSATSAPSAAGTPP
jgi:hypothetical protein